MTRRAFTLRLPDDLDRWLEAAAFVDGDSKTNLVLRALGEYRSSHDRPAIQRAQAAANSAPKAERGKSSE